MLYLLCFLFLLKCKPSDVLKGAAFSGDIFSFEFVAYQLLQCHQIPCTNKQQVEILQTLVQSSLLGKI